MELRDPATLTPLANPDGVAPRPVPSQDHARDPWRAVRLTAWVLLTPFAAAAAILLSPVLLAWTLWQRSWMSTHGLRVLLPAQARTVAAFAEAAIPSGEPAETWIEAAHTVDSYLSGFRSPRKWRSVWLWTAIEWIPLTHGRWKFSSMPIEARRRFCDTHFRTNRGVHGALATARQLVRMGYYSNVDTQRRLGFVPWEERDVKVHYTPELRP